MHKAIYRPGMCGYDPKRLKLPKLWRILKQAQKLQENFKILGIRITVMNQASGLDIVVINVVSDCLTTISVVSINYSAGRRSLLLAHGRLTAPVLPPIYTAALSRKLKALSPHVHLVICLTSGSLYTHNWT